MSDRDPHHARASALAQRVNEAIHEPTFLAELREIVALRPLDEVVCELLLKAITWGHYAIRTQLVRLCIDLGTDAAPFVEYIYKHYHQLTFWSGDTQKVLAGLFPVLPSIEEALCPLLSAEEYPRQRLAAETLNRLPVLADTTIEALFDALEYPCHLQAIATHAPATRKHFEKLVEQLEHNPYKEYILRTIGKMAFAEQDKHAVFSKILQEPVLPHTRQLIHTAAIELSRLELPEAREALIQALPILVDEHTHANPNTSRADELFEVILPLVHHTPALIPALEAALEIENPHHIRRIARVLARFKRSPGLPATISQSLQGRLESTFHETRVFAAIAIYEIFPDDRGLLMRVLPTLGKTAKSLHAHMAPNSRPVPPCVPNFLRPLTDPAQDPPEGPNVFDHIDSSIYAHLTHLFAQALEHPNIEASAMAAHTLTHFDRPAFTLALHGMREGLQHTSLSIRKRAALGLKHFLQADITASERAQIFAALTPMLTEANLQLRLRVLQALEHAEMSLIPLAPKLLRLLHGAKREARTTLLSLLETLRKDLPQGLQNALETLSHSDLSPPQLEVFLRQGPLKGPALRQLAFLFAERSIWRHTQRHQDLDPAWLSWLRAHRTWHTQQATHHNIPAPSMQPPTTPDEAASTPEAQAAYALQRTILAALQDDPTEAACATMHGLLAPLIRPDCPKSTRRVQREFHWQLAKTFELLIAQAEEQTTTHWKEQFEDALF